MMRMKDIAMLGFHIAYRIAQTMTNIADKKALNKIEIIYFHNPLLAIVLLIKMRIRI